MFLRRKSLPVSGNHRQCSEFRNGHDSPAIVAITVASLTLLACQNASNANTANGWKDRGDHFTGRYRAPKHGAVDHRDGHPGHVGSELRTLYQGDARIKAN